MIFGVRMSKANTMSAEVELEVPFHDVDALQIVWHGNYYKYFEIARTKLLRKINYDVEEMKSSGYSWPVIETRCKYVKPLRYGQIMRVYATLWEYENRLKIRYLVEDAYTRQKHATGETIQVAVNLETNEMSFYSPQVLLSRINKV